MRTGVAGRVFPGAVLLVARQGRILFEEAYGTVDYFGGGGVDKNTAFDLASLTKPLATAIASLILVQEGRLDLDRPCVIDYPALIFSDKTTITVRDLLCHRSGLPAYRPFYIPFRWVPDGERKQSLIEAVIQEPLLAAPGERVEYSDLGFILLQQVIETISGMGLDRWVSEKIYQPLSVAPLFFREVPEPLPAISVAATEHCPVRCRLLVGEVHDENAWIMGGVAGHAGLFGTARATYTLLQALLDADQKTAQRSTIFDGDLVNHYFTRQKDSSWALGFDTPSTEGSSAGSKFSRDSVGHLGFTGTSFWMDRPREVIVVLLTNRVHPSRDNVAIRAFRPQLHDEVMSALG